MSQVPTTTGLAHPMIRPARRPTYRRSAALLLLCLAVPNCAALPYDHDALERLDRIEIRAGDAQQRNITLQTVDPLPDGKSAAVIPSDGKRTLAVTETYYDWALQSDGDAAAVVVGPEDGANDQNFED